MKEDLNSLNAFLTVARERSFTRAAAQIGVSQSSLSRTVRMLEAQMGVPLLVRTTRSVSLTDAGERLVATIEPKLDDIRSEVEALRSSTTGPVGTVRITTTDLEANNIVWPRVQSLLRQYPEIKLEILTDYGLTDIVADRFDIGIRLAESVAQDMIATRVAPDLTMAIVGTPEYLKTRPAVRKPQDLMVHNCINLRLPTRNALLPWELKKGKRQTQVRVEGQLTFNNVYQIRKAALGGFGLAYLPKDFVEKDVEAKRLQWVLEDWFPTYEGLHAFYPSRRKSSRAVELVIEALKAGYCG